MAEDDPDDRFIIEKAFGASGVSGSLRFVEDGRELLDYLLRRRRYARDSALPRPGCVLLDLKMPRLDGRQVLQEIRKIPELKNLPVIVLTTSDSDKDREHCRRLGATDYFTKPAGFNEFTALIVKIESLCYV